MFLPSSTPSARYIKDLAAAADADVEFVRLDSVGGTTLYITAEAIRQGVNFPVRHIIGSQWDCEGYVLTSMHARPQQMKPFLRAFRMKSDGLGC